jgi:hypothetical protein
VISQIYLHRVIVRKTENLSYLTVVGGPTGNNPRQQHSVEMFHYLHMHFWKNVCHSLNK